MYLIKLVSPDGCLGRMPPFLDSALHVDILTALEGSAKLLRVCMRHLCVCVTEQFPPSTCIRALHSIPWVLTERVHVPALGTAFWRNAVSELMEFTISWDVSMFLY